MRKWVLYSITAVSIWGVWGIIPKATSPALSPQVMQVVSTLGLVPVALLFILSKGWRSGTDFAGGIFFAAITGLCGSTGNLALLAALKRGGETSVVLPLTGMFPLITAILARIFLRERLNRMQVLGIAMALVALYVFNASEAAVAATGHPQAPGNHVSTWMTYSLFSLLAFGIAGITQKLATNRISTQLSTICFAFGFVPVALAILATQPLHWDIPGKDGLLALLFGVLMGFAMLAQFAAYGLGKAAVVTAVTALYPALTVILAVIVFGEQMNAWKLVAVTLALGAGVALSHER